MEYDDKENELEGKNLRGIFSIVADNEVEPSRLFESHSSQPVEENNKVEKGSQGQKAATNLLQLPRIHLSTPSHQSTSSQKASNKNTSPGEVLRGIDSGILEQKYARELRRRDSPKDASEPDVTYVIKEDEPSEKSNIPKVYLKNLKPNKIGPNTEATMESKEKPKKARKKMKEEEEVIDSPSPKDHGLTDSKHIVSPGRISSNDFFRPNDLVWVKWRYDMFLVGKLESKPSSTRSLWSCKFLFQNKLSLPHFVTSTDIIPLSYLCRGDLMVNILSKSKVKYKSGTFERWHDEGKAGAREFAEMIVEGKCDVVSLKSIAIHRKLFLELQANRLQPMKEANISAAMDERMIEMSDELTSWTKNEKVRRGRSRNIKVILSGTADKKSVKDRIKRLGLELVDKVTQAEVLISEGTKRTAKYLTALIIGLPIVNTAWLSTSLSVPKQSLEPLQRVLMGFMFMLLGDRKFVKDWRAIMECLGAIATNTNPDIVLVQNEKYQLRSKYGEKNGKQRGYRLKIVLLASTFAEMIVNRNFGSIFIP